MNEDYFFFDLVKKTDDPSRMILLVEESYRDNKGSRGYSCETFALTVDELQELYELIGGYLVQNTNLLDAEVV